MEKNNGEGSAGQYRLYCHENKLTHLKYFGITKKTLKQRSGKDGRGYLSKDKDGNYNQPKIAEAILKDGWNNFNHFEIYKNLTCKLAKELEKFYIHIYNTFRKGYNSTPGGDCRSDFINEVRNKTTGEIFQNITVAAEKYNVGKTSLTRAIKSKYKCKNCYWELVANPWNISEAKQERGEVVCIRNKTTGEIFKSMYDAAKKYNCRKSSLMGAIKKHCKCKGCYWEKITEPWDLKDAATVEKKNQKQCKKIRNITLNICYASITIAAKENNVCAKAITQAIQHGWKCNDCDWEYID